MKQTSKLRRVGLTLAALVVTLVMTVTTTYAWFTTSATPSVSGMDFTVTTGPSSLLVAYSDTGTAADATALVYEQSLDSDDFTALMTALKASQTGNFVLNAASLGATATDGKRYDINGTSEIAANTTGTNGTWFEFNINFRATDASTVVKFNTKSFTLDIDDATSTVRPVYAWDDLTGANYGVTNITKNAAVYSAGGYAARMSFLGNASDSVTGGTTPATEYFWNPRDTATTTINDERIGDTNYYVFGNASTNNFAVDYYNATMQLTTAAISKPGSYVADEDTTDDFVVVLGTTASTGGFFYGYTTVRVWLDGWDANAHNGILTDAFTLGFQFSATVPTP